MGKQLTVNESFNKNIMVGYDYHYDNEFVLSSCFVDGVEIFSVKDIIHFLIGTEIDIRKRKSGSETLRKNNLTWILNKWEIKKVGLSSTGTALSFTNREGIMLLLGTTNSTEEKSNFLIKEIIENVKEQPEFTTRALRYEMLKIDDLRYDERYQRKVSDQKVREIVRKFDIGVIGALIVSQRENGQYYLVDGQHRVQAMKLLNIIDIMCVVHTGLTVQDEALMFSKCNTTRKQPSALDNYKALLLANDPDTIELNKTIEEMGYCIDFSNQPVVEESHNKYSLRCTISLRNIYKTSGTEGVQQVLRICKAIDNGRPIQQEILGIGRFCRAQKGKFDEDELIKRLNSTSRAEIIAKSRQMADIMKIHNEHAYSNILVQIYNKNKSNKLSLDEK